MITSTRFIWRTLQLISAADRKAVRKVSLFIDDMDGIAYTSSDQIHFSARYIQGYSGNVKNEFTGVIYHEMAHVWQWNGNGQAPGGLIEGIADFVRLKAGYIPSHWVKPGQGNRWDQGYDVTARFLDYCNGLRNGFVVELNKKMKTGYSNNYFVDLLGKRVDQLWNDYKAKYGEGEGGDPNKYIVQGPCSKFGNSSIYCNDYCRSIKIPKGGFCMYITTDHDPNYYDCICVVE